MDKRIFIRLLKLILSTVLVSSSQLPNNLRITSKISGITNKTPCCLDRITTISCQRLYMTNPRYFIYECSNNADFAFVQCCKTCFDHKSSNGPRLNYTDISYELLTNTETAICYDKRGEEWCENFVKRNNFWKYIPYKNLNCSNQPYAFRCCRASCGYCSIKEKKALVNYNYEKAMDSRLCGDLKISFVRDIKKFQNNEKKYGSESIMIRKLMNKRMKKNLKDDKCNEIRGSVFGGKLQNYSNIKINKLLRDQVYEKEVKRRIDYILSRGPLFYP
ncbi:Hypothetical protein SRAE_0000026000 [Strongyloides ratti]|uniref:ShKT domain-containing protein n=1 Tax=Strongyloides ratti TaxID=34506 RepID=A0A090KUP0_STRRB|nr:Hypothetical protein SRAE_0000026000 [Strongyloides ratti]CEF61131.1 Hypothetical protein SRAE_0000026000 [Strongyloides ratti]